MPWVTTTGWRGTLTKTAAATGFVGIEALGVTVPANAAPTGTDLPAMTNDPGCEVFGWRLPRLAWVADVDPVIGRQRCHPVLDARRIEAVEQVDGRRSLSGSAPRVPVAGPESFFR